MLSSITYLPLIGAVILLFVPKDQHEWIRRIALISSLASFVVSLALPYYFDSSTQYLFSKTR